MPSPPSFPLPPGSTLGVIGGGQLGRMLAMAAARLGLDTVVLDPDPDCPAGRVARAVITAPYDDSDALLRLAEASDAVTYEFENVPADAVRALEGLGVAVAPGSQALAVAQDRVAEKTFLRTCDISTVPFVAVDSAADIAPALLTLGAPALLKTRRDGYDGRGQVWVADAGEAEAAFARIGAAPAILEQRAPIVRELSVIAARGRDWSVAAYPIGENIHVDGVLRRTMAPASVDDRLAWDARYIARLILEKLDYIGVIGVELFEVRHTPGDATFLYVNEIAPRVHNTGHWTLDGCQVDQFEQHVRAVAGWPLGPTDPLVSVEMTNLLGDEALDWAALAADPAARLWLYGKREVAPGRKMGHVNRLSPQA